MSQRLAADQHSRLVQFLPGLVLPAGIDLALILFPRPPVHPVVGDVLNLPGMGLIDGRGVLGPVTMNVSTVMDVLPHLLLCRRVGDPFDDLLRILADDGA